MRKFLLWQPFGSQWNRRKQKAGRAFGHQSWSEAEVGDPPSAVLPIFSFTSSFLHLGDGSMKDGQE